ncbi:MAG: transcriptional repressor [Bacillaceae bacterium]|nr:transcriptional repressor [Bacillaceae bacterium]
MANPQTESIIQLLKDHAIRVTPQRIAIIKTLKELDHPTAEEIHDHLMGEYASMSFATVYNTLRSLKEVGIVREIRCGEGCTRFELLEHDHFHLLCKKCGQIDDIHIDSDINLKHVENKSGYALTDLNIEFYGLCPSCQSS